MRRRHFQHFAPICPVCAAAGRIGRALGLAYVGQEADGDILAGILHCPDAACRHEYPILAGIPVIVPDLPRLMTERGVELLTADDLDPMLESLVGDAIGPDSWFDAGRQMLSTYGWDAYADLDPAEAPNRSGPIPGAARRCVEALLDLAGSNPAQTVLDIGCGAGRTSFTLAAALPGALVLGLDTHLGLLRLAQGARRGEISYPRRRIGLVYDRRAFSVALPGADRVDFWACDALALPFAAPSTDLAVALNLLDCVAEPQRLLQGLAEQTRPGGRLLLATPYDWSTRATQPQHWLGGHSQRASHRGSGEAFLRTLLRPGAHPNSISGLKVIGETDGFAWHTRLHDRSSVQYSTHLVALACDPAPG